MAEIVRLNWCEFPFSLSLISFFYTEKDHEMSDYCYLSFLSGWDKHSYGYHGDDGHSFCSSGTGQPYGPTFTTGDVIGCCVNLINNTCFYTKNGHSLGNRAKMLPVLSEHKPAEYAYTIVMTFWLETYWTWKTFICFVCLVLVDVHLSFFFFSPPLLGVAFTDLPVSETLIRLTGSRTETVCFHFHTFWNALFSKFKGW